MNLNFSVAYDFQTGNNKIQLLMEYKIVIEKGFITDRLNFLSYIFIFRKQFYSVVFGLKIISHGNPDNNSESHCIIFPRDPISGPLSDIYKASLLSAAHLKYLSNF
jgi:hypothetical protein